jgi:DNA-3-methyladenine glycosylase I
MNDTRCTWANMANPRYIAYHDHEWGVPCHDETTLFEMLNLEGAQAGLSWETILNKRDTYRAAFDGWDAERSRATTTPRWPNCWPTPASCATA